MYLAPPGFSQGSPGTSLSLAVGGTVTLRLILVPSLVALINNGTFLLSCSGHQGDIVYLQSKYNWAMLIFFAKSSDTVHGGERIGRLRESRAFGPPLSTQPLLALMCSFVISISGTRVRQCSAITAPDIGF